MADTYEVVVAYAVRVESIKALDPDNSSDDYDKLLRLAVLKMWTDGYERVASGAVVSYEQIER